MNRRILLCAAVGCLLLFVATQAQLLSPSPRQAQPQETNVVSLQNDDLEPEPLTPSQRETERETVAKLRSLKNEAGQAKCLVITEGPDKVATSVTFLGGKIDDESLRLTARLIRLGTVNADKCGISDDQLKYLAGLSAMNSLVLSNTPISGKGMAHLRPLTNLITLHLSNTKVSDAALDDIAQLKKLKILNLSNTKVTDKGMKRLLPLAELNWLLLSETAITDAGLRPLAGMKKLGRLTVLKTKVTSEGADRLKQSLPKLQKVDL